MEHAGEKEKKPRDSEQLPLEPTISLNDSEERLLGDEKVGDIQQGIGAAGVAETVSLRTERTALEKLPFRIEEGRKVWSVPLIESDSPTRAVRAPYPIHRQKNSD